MSKGPSAKRKPVSSDKAQQSVSTWYQSELTPATINLTRDRIVAAAIELANKGGLESVSIRNLARQLDASPMALYHYIPSKRDLFNLMLDATYVDFVFPPAADLDWRSVLRLFAQQSRRSFEKYGWSMSLQTEDREYGPEAIRIFEWYLERLSESGLDVRFAVHVIGVLFDFVIGFVFNERSNRPQADGPSVGPRRIFSEAVLASGKFPLVAKFVSLGVEPPDDAAFDRCLQWILTGLAPDMPTKRSAKIAKVK